MKSFKALNQNSQGFSLLELMLVLAIFGLLIVGIFMAFAQGQIIRRDNQRKSALQLVANNLERVKASPLNHFDYPHITDASAVPAVTGDTCSTSGTDLFVCWFDPKYAPADPQRGIFAISASDNKDPLALVPYHYYTKVTATVGVPHTPTKSLPADIVYTRGLLCNSSSYNPGEYKLEMRLESGGVFCIDNH